jgi:hypothetical protein
VIERRAIRPPTNGSGVTRESPLPERIAEHERRVSAALTEPTPSSDLADWAVIAAHEFAKSEHKAALDPTVSPDSAAARARAEALVIRPAPTPTNSSVRKSVRLARSAISRWSAASSGVCPKSAPMPPTRMVMMTVICLVIAADARLPAAAKLISYVKEHHDD